MNFFQQLAMQEGGVDITMRIMQKKETLTINIMPGSGSSTIQPLIFTGTPAELDEHFFSVIAPAVHEVKGLVTNLDEVKKELQGKAESKKPKEEKKKEASKGNGKVPGPLPKKKKVIEGSLFTEEKPEEESIEAAEKNDEEPSSEDNS